MTSDVQGSRIHLTVEELDGGDWLGVSNEDDKSSYMDFVSIDSFNTFTSAPLRKVIRESTQELVDEQVFKILQDSDKSYLLDEDEEDDEDDDDATIIMDEYKDSHDDVAVISPCPTPTPPPPGLTVLLPKHHRRTSSHRSRSPTSRRHHLPRNGVIKTKLLALGKQEEVAQSLHDAEHSMEEEKSQKNPSAT